MKEFSIGKRVIGPERNIYICAEVGTTCNGDPKTAMKLIDAAKEADMDAVKFQILDPEDKFSDRKATFTYKRHTGESVTENLYKMLKEYVMTPEEWREIKKYGDSQGMTVFATPDHEAAVDLMEKLQMPAYKIATWDATYVPLVSKIAKLDKPVVLDLGASDVEEVARMLEVFKEEKNDNVILLHCFHTHDFGQMNLRTVEYLRETFGYFSGFSAPDTNNAIDYATLAFKPVYIEKRLTLDRKDPHHHHAQALEPGEMKAYVKTIRELQKAIGEYALIPTDTDMKQRLMHFRGLVAKRAIKKGEKLTDKNVACRRPLADRLDPKFLPQVLGRKATKDLKENEPITWDSI